MPAQYMSALNLGAKSFGGISYDLLSDFHPKGEVAKAHGACPIRLGRPWCRHKRGRTSPAAKRWGLEPLSNEVRSLTFAWYYVNLIHSSLHRQRDPQIAGLKVNYKVDSLRSEPRFQDLMRRMGFSS